MSTTHGEYYSIEIGDDSELSTCSCCGQQSDVAHGFVYKNGHAYAVYYAGWVPKHPEAKVSIALSIGNWDEEASADERTCFGLEVMRKKKELVIRTIDATESPWAHSELLGRMLSREDAEKHPLIGEVYTIASKIVRKHEAIRTYLGCMDIQV